MMAILIIAALVMHIASPGFSKMAKIRAKKKSCFANMKNIEGANELYAVEHKRKDGSLEIASINQLLDAGYLKDIPQCPSQGEYKMFGGAGVSNIDVLCGVHGFMSKQEGEEKGKGVDDLPFMEKTDINVIIAYTCLIAAGIIFIIDSFSSLILKKA